MLEPLRRRPWEPHTREKERPKNEFIAAFEMTGHPRRQTVSTEPFLQIVKFCLENKMVFGF